MKAPKRTHLVICILFSLLVSGVSYSQWKNVAPDRVTPFLGSHGDPEYGAIHYKAGVLWAGWRDLWSSSDTGKTWQKSFLPLTNDDIVTDIDFYDKFNGIVSTAEEVGLPSNGVFLTRDGGQTWNKILTAPHCVNLIFNGSPNIIQVLTVGDFPTPTGLLHTSIDGGSTWTTSWAGGEYSQCLTVGRDNTLYVLNCSDATAGLPGFVSSSTDLGKTWKQSPAEVDGDSYTICADSCDASRLYIANEDYTATVDNNSSLYYSSDKGNTWMASLQFDPPYFSGAMTCTANTIYASSLRRGIYRSLDQGLSWKAVGGPPAVAFDGRDIACINDNIIFVLDGEGSIWETTNSGGDSLLANPGFNDLVLSLNSLFSSDSIIVCDTSISKFIHLQPKGCLPPTISTISVLGSDSSSYTPIPLSGDSIGVRFMPIYDSLNSAQLLVTLTNGAQKIVTLGGFGIPRAPLTISTIPDQKIDTLGGSATIPITINGFLKPEDVTIVLHYDTVLTYLGSFSSAGVKLDMPGEQWNGRSKLKITGAQSNLVLGSARFEVYNDSVPLQVVRFDSITVLSAPTACQYVSPAATTSTLTPLSGCGVITVSR
ncbi:MAG: sialidase family protein, partial [Bacteroidota bacterium]|nr:sialidase family protein [Bacteroidota bacterium]